MHPFSSARVSTLPFRFCCCGSTSKGSRTGRRRGLGPSLLAGLAQALPLAPEPGGGDTQQRTGREGRAGRGRGRRAGPGAAARAGDPRPAERGRQPGLLRRQRADRRHRGLRGGCRLRVGGAGAGGRRDRLRAARQPAAARAAAGGGAQSFRLARGARRFRALGRRAGRRRHHPGGLGGRPRPRHPLPRAGRGSPAARPGPAGAALPPLVDAAHLAAGGRPRRRQGFHPCPAGRDRPAVAGPAQGDRPRGRPPGGRGDRLAGGAEALARPPRRGLQRRAARPRGAAPGFRGRPGRAAGAGVSCAARSTACWWWASRW